MVDTIRLLLAILVSELDAIARGLSREELALVVALSGAGSWVLLRGGTRLAERGRGGEMSRQGGMALLLGMVGVVIGGAFSVRLATGWNMSRCLVTSLGAISLTSVANRTGLLKAIRGKLKPRVKEQPPEPPTAPPAAPALQECQFCGAVNRSEARFCRGCGAPLG